MSSPAFRFRLATLDDAPALLSIYAPYVEKTAISFEYDVPSLDEFRRRIADISRKYPYLVAEDENGQLLGYAYTHTFIARKAYDHCAESTIYLALDARKHGLGKRFYRAIEELSLAQNIYNLYACIGEPQGAAGQLVRELGLNVKSFYMGGGTPTTLTADQMDRLLTKLEQNFDFNGLAELTIEAGRPDTIDEEKLRVLRAHNTTRVSINPQTMEDNVLAAIGRRHTADDIRRAMEQVRAAGFPHVNMDLIAGLPEDTPEGFARSLDEVISMGADNITVHTLSLKKGSRIMLEGSRIPGADEVAQMLDYADPTLRKHGFAPYYLYRQKYMSGSFENVGWTKPGGTGLYNIYIMEELHSILSLGAGGSTKMVGGGQIRRAFNAKYPREYIDRPEKRRANLMDFARFYAEQGE